VLQASLGFGVETWVLTHVVLALETVQSQGHPAAALLGL
jgi:hypothetical protein